MGWFSYKLHFNIAHWSKEGYYWCALLTFDKEIHFANVSQNVFILKTFEMFIFNSKILIIWNYQSLSHLDLRDASTSKNLSQWIKLWRVLHCVLEKKIACWYMHGRLLLHYWSTKSTNWPKLWLRQDTIHLHTWSIQRSVREDGAKKCNFPSCVILPHQMTG